ncbi:MAG: 16S rRNA (guanine(527)-N(7))-methyltransferase RsmG [Rhodothermales bacterium]|nr:16S rRNA (guanine(527)-N(7))-methyltransferase RsmG [Rhodothermales bacterium]
MEITPQQEALLLTFAEQLTRFNATHNLVSRMSTGDILDRHIRHCLYLARRGFPAGATVVDWGTGGGLPAIPLALLFPETRFVAVDAVEKKIMVVRAIARRLGLDNLEAWHGRAEAWPGRTHYSVSRATAPLATLWSWHHRVVEPLDCVDPSCWPPGLVCLKGGDLTTEIADLSARYPATRVDVQPLEDLGAPPYFEEKLMVHVVA